VRAVHCQAMFSAARNAAGYKPNTTCLDLFLSRSLFYVTVNECLIILLCRLFVVLIVNEQ
jgi:hypothetical protein